MVFPCSSFTVRGERGDGRAGQCAGVPAEPSVGPVPPLPSSMLTRTDTSQAIPTHSVPWPEILRMSAALPEAGTIFFYFFFYEERINSDI